MTVTVELSADEISQLKQFTQPRELKASSGKLDYAHAGEAIEALERDQP
jgi:hypothetical protein